MYKVEAIQREADPEPWQFEFGNEVYSLPSDVDMRVLAALDGGRLDDALRLLLGVEQYERMQRSPYIFKADKLEALLRSYLDDLGLDLGKPSASTVSSASTGTPSRPISNVRTA